MAINRQERAAERRRERQAYAERMREQARINAEAEESGAGGVRINDRRDRSGLVLAGKSLSGPSENKALTPETETKEGDALAGVEFASAAAEQRARESRLSAVDFKRKRASSDRGFTVADVDRIAG